MYSDTLNSDTLDSDTLDSDTLDKMDTNTPHSGKIRIEHTLTPIPLFTIMENTIYVIQGLTLLTESLDPPKIISRYLPVNFDTISRATLLFENLRFLVSAWDTNVGCLSLSNESVRCCEMLYFMQSSWNILHFTALATLHALYTKVFPISLSSSQELHSACLVLDPL